MDSFTSTSTSTYKSKHRRLDHFRYIVDRLELAYTQVDAGIQ